MSLSFEQLLERDGRLVYKTRGKSMLPMLYQERDLVIIEPISEPPKPMDVVLYKRGASYVLHRVIHVLEDECLIRGDNTYSLERVPNKSMLGKLVFFVRKGKRYEVTDRRYLYYARFWCAVYPVRMVFFRCRRLCVRILRKLGLLAAVKRLLRRA